jgi:hypothetical protein
MKIGAARSARHRKLSGAPKLPTSPRCTGKKKDAEPSRLVNNNGRQETKMETWRPNLAHPTGSTSRLALQGAKRVSGAGSK